MFEWSGPAALRRCCILGHLKLLSSSCKTTPADIFTTEMEHTESVSEAGDKSSLREHEVQHVELT